MRRYIILHKTLFTVCIYPLSNFNNTHESGRGVQMRSVTAGLLKNPCLRYYRTVLLATPLLYGLFHIMKNPTFYAPRALQRRATVISSSFRLSWVQWTKYFYHSSALHSMALSGWRQHRKFPISWRSEQARYTKKKRGEKEKEIAQVSMAKRNIQEWEREREKKKDR